MGAKDQTKLGFSRTRGLLRPGAISAALAALTLAAAVPAEAQEAMGPNDPLAGFSDGTAFLRSADNQFILLPNGRLQIDGYAYTRPTDDMPEHTVLVRRARLELAGWVGPWFYYSIAGDFALGAPAAADPRPQSFLAATDDYISIAPFGDRMILQIGQYDAPFTLENRTSDKYFDFMERSLTVRAFAEPANKEVGAMLHGMPLTNRGIYYSLGVFNGDGQNFKNVDNNFDVMGRAWVAPFAFTRVDALKAATIGGSFWVGQRGATGLALNTQTTQGGFKLLDPKWVHPDGKTPMEMHQSGDLRAFALEVNLPIAHKFGFRFEYVHKNQELDEDDVSIATSNGKLIPLGHDVLDGWAFYAQAWAWVLGDDRIIGEPGLQLPTRLKKFATTPPRHGLMITARVDDLHENVTTDAKILANPNVGLTHIVTPQIGVNYWYSKRFRATFNYEVNVLGGDTATITKAKAKNGNHAAQHEFGLRLGVAL